MDDKQLLALVSDQLSNSDQNFDYETPLEYYLGGNSNAGILDTDSQGQYVRSDPEETDSAGRSKVVSTDVCDVIEWIMPQIMKSFTQNNEVVIFDPTGPMDEQQSEIESEYVYDVLMKENEGFIILHQFIKDALMQKNGIIKVWYEDDENTDISDWTGLSDEQIQSVLAAPTAELLSHSVIQVIDPASQQPVNQHSARIAVIHQNGRIVLESVAPEDFRVNSDHNSISLEEAKFTAHLLKKTISDLREEGVSEDIISQLTPGEDFDRNEYRFQLQGETTLDQSETPEDDSLDEVDIAECYLFCDYDGDGIAEYNKVTVDDHENPSIVIDIEPVDECPWVSTTAIIMSHKWRGLSIYDRIKMIQDQKTALWQNVMENMYLQNNQRHIVIEGKSTADTINDLMLSRPGGIVRAKTADAVIPLATPQLSSLPFDMMSYLDSVRAGRTGVAPEGEAAPHNIGERLGSEGFERMMTAKEELVGLIVRVVAETGIKPLCIKIRNLCTKHVDAIQDYKFRGQWFKVHPTQWPHRSKTTVRVGTGTGNHERQILAVKEVIGLQAGLQQQPGQTLVNPTTIFKAYDDFCKFSGLNSAVGYFVDPSSPEGQQAAQQTQAQMAQEKQQQLELQVKQLEIQKQIADAEMQKVQAQFAGVQAKHESEQAKNELDAYKATSDAEIKQLTEELKLLEMIARKNKEDESLALKRDEMILRNANELTRIEAEKERQENENFSQNVKTVTDSAA